MSKFERNLSTPLIEIDRLRLTKFSVFLWHTLVDNVIFNLSLSPIISEFELQLLVPSRNHSAQFHCCLPRKMPVMIMSMLFPCDSD